MILMNVLMLMFACGDKSDDTASPDDTDTATGDAYSFEGMDFVFQSAEGFELVGDSFSVDFTRWRV